MRESIALLLVLVFLLASGIIFAKPALSSADAAGDSWASKAPMHEARTGVGVAVVNGKIYAIGGANQEGFRATNEEYDPATDTWTLKASMPTPRSYFGIAVHQNKIYCLGGYTSGFSVTGVDEVYDTATDTWETKAPMPTPELNIQANVADGKIYVIGGNTNGTFNQVYDPATNSWTTKASIPTAVNSYASTAVGNKIYIFTSNLTQIYNAENDSWSLGTPAPSPVILAAAGVTTGLLAPERIYVFGANAQQPFWQLTTKGFITQSYNPQTDSWTACASIPTGRYDASAAVVNDKVYLIGGFTMEFPTDRFTLNAQYTYSALNEQYTPLGFGNVPPVVSIVSPENRNYNSSSVPLAFTLNKPTAWIGYSLDGQETIPVTGNATITGLTSGFHNITVYAKDEFENIGTSETIYFSVEEPFPTTLVVASVVLVAVIGIGLLVYFKKRKR